MKKKILITGAAGFIGFSFALKLLENNHQVIGLDNLDNYYSVKLKKKRLKELNKFKNFSFFKINIEKENFFEKLRKKKIDHIFHFAAQAGVRYSVVNPKKYVYTNILGTINVFRFAVLKKIKSVFFASSSSVYGDSKKFPQKETNQLSPKNIYATSKIINEVVAKSFSNNFKIKIYALRFFTIYGEWGRPDMLLFKIMKNSIKGTELKLNNKGNHFRDFTYINDVTSILYLLLYKKINKKFDVYNISSNNPQSIKKIINNFKKNFSKLKVKNVSRNNLDVFKTHGDNKKILKLLNFKNFTKFNKGIKTTYSWYKSKNDKLIF